MPCLAHQVARVDAILACLTGLVRRCCLARRHQVAQRLKLIGSIGLVAVEGVLVLVRCGPLRVVLHPLHGLTGNQPAPSAGGVAQLFETLAQSELVAGVLLVVLHAEVFGVSAIPRCAGVATQPKQFHQPILASQASLAIWVLKFDLLVEHLLLKISSAIGRIGLSARSVSGAAARDSAADHAGGGGDKE